MKRWIVAGLWLSVWAPATGLCCTSGTDVYVDDATAFNDFQRSWKYYVNESEAGGELGALHESAARPKHMAHKAELATELNNVVRAQALVQGVLEDVCAFFAQDRPQALPKGQVGEDDYDQPGLQRQTSQVLQLPEKLAKQAEEDQNPYAQMGKYQVRQLLQARVQALHAALVDLERENKSKYAPWRGLNRSKIKAARKGCRKLAEGVQLALNLERGLDHDELKDLEKAHES